jgi:hypothetical protein
MPRAVDRTRALCAVHLGRLDSARVNAAGTDADALMTLTTAARTAVRLNPEHPPVTLLGPGSDLTDAFVPL